MSEEQNKQHVISNIPSEAINQALDDLEEILRINKEWHVNMNVWARLQPADPNRLMVTERDFNYGNLHCSVCLGGAVMARVAGYDVNAFRAISHPSHMATQGFFSHEEALMIHAMDAVRTCSPRTVLHAFDIPVTDDRWEQCSVALRTQFDQDSGRFIAERRVLSVLLQHWGY